MLALRKVGRGLARKARGAYHGLRYPRFQPIKERTDGLLTARAYSEIYRTALSGNDLDIIDIGAAGGGVSIACALAQRDRGWTSSVIAIEKCEGGSRTQIGDFQDNLMFLNDNLRHFGVHDRVRIFPQHLTDDNLDELMRLVRTPRIAGFVHDADGRIDRDFLLFWPRLVDGGFIIIDDYVFQRNFKPVSDRYPAGGTKKLLTYRLLNQFREWGLMQVDGRLGPVAFGHKPANGDFSSFDVGVCDRIRNEVQKEYMASVSLKTS